MIEPLQAKQAAMIIELPIVCTLAFHILLHVLQWALPSHELPMK